MKRTVAHLASALVSLGILTLRLKAAMDSPFLLWYVPNLASSCAIVAFLLLSLRNRPLHADEKPIVFFAALLSTNFVVLVSLFGELFPIYRTAPLVWLRTAGKLLNMLSMPFFLWTLFSLGRGFAILPEAHVLRTDGVYRISRHPLYLTYTFWCATQNMIYQTWSALAFSLIQAALFRYRAQCEEKVLSEAFPEYADYRKRVRWLGTR